MRKTLLHAGVGVCVALFIGLVVSCSTTQQSLTSATPPDGDQAPPVKVRKLASMAKFAPAAATEARDDPESFAAQDWLQHSIDGAENSPPPFSAFATARNDWFGMKARPSQRV